MDINRLKSLRAGNRASVTKTCRKIEDIIGSGDSSFDVEEIKQLLIAIDNKKKTLVSLDEQILNEVTTEGITDEIMDTEEYHQELDGKIRKYTQHLKPNTTPASTYLRSTATEFVPSTSYNTCTFTLTQEIPQTSSSTASQNHRLPKLSLPSFSGDILEWQYFWDSYESTVHLNHTLTDVQKFSYLKSLLQFDAASVISGLTMRNANYQTAIDLLRNRYGQSHKITNAYMRSLLDLSPPQDTITSLRSFHDKSEAFIRGLESLGQSQEMFGSLLIPVILDKLPPEFRKTITRENGSDNWEIKKLREAITKEITIRESGYIDCTQGINAAVSSASFITGVRRDFKKKGNAHRSSDKPKKKSCIFCNGDHWTNECKEEVDYENRLAIVKEKKLCFNCLGNHRIAECHSKGTCKSCHKKHHSSLCKKTTSNTDEIRSKKAENDTSMLYTASSEEKTTVLLKTAVSSVVYQDTCIEANILFDEGAQQSFITEELAKTLNVRREGSISLSLSTFGNTEKKVRNLDKTTIHLKSTEGELIPIKVLIVPNIASPLQNQTVPSFRKFPYLRGLQLAHPVMQGDEFEISLLIGGDFYWDVVQDDIIRGNGPTAVSSKLGYLLSGPVRSKTPNASTSMMNILVHHKQEECDIEKFWKLESLGVSNKEQHDPKMSEIINNYMDNSIRKKNGKYVAKLPWKDDSSELPTNEEMAKRRTETVIRRLEKDSEIFRKYGEIIAEQEKLGFMEKVTADNTTCSNRVHYIPHHPVRKDSATTPIRIVYDCSCRPTTESLSLNDCLASYPPIMTDLIEILVRFRMHKHAVVADIEKAFLQIELDPMDRDVTRFYWLKDPSDLSSPLITYRFRAVLFGATCSPFILSATLMKHFRDNPSSTSDELQITLYVDNVLTSFIDENSALKFYTEARQENYYQMPDSTSDHGTQTQKKYAH